MKLRRKVAAIVLMATMVVCGETRRALAQNAANEAPPDLRMLMNLDLFEPRHNDAKYAAAPSAAPSDDSMLDQIRTLNQMGYLANPEDSGNDAPAPRAAAGAHEFAPPPPQSQGAPQDSDVGPPPEPPMPASQPSFDAEGPNP
jgi:hypothetical protein